MKNCFIKGFNKNYEKLIVIGSDSPDIPSGIITDAFNKLEKYDSVIGPCKDGGFYLLGFTNKHFFSNNIFWNPMEHNQSF
jgi:glycosyltransferase A (GT-A) superfamily protein (DUF2064 family)